MKKRFIYLFAAVCSMGFFTACSDDDKVNLPSETTTFTTESGLLLTVNDGQMVGKTATFTPSNGTSSATITLRGEPLDLSALGGGASKAYSQPASVINTCGVIPGSPEVTIPVDVKDGKFSGSFTADYCTFNYDGNVTKSTLQFTISGLELKDKSLAETVWSPMKPYFNELGMQAGAPYVNWISTEKFYPGFPPNIFATMMCSSSFIPVATPENADTTLSVNDAIVTFLKDVKFCSDGNIVANYLDSKTLQLAVSPDNIIQYVLTGNNSMLLYINPQLIIYDVMQQGRAADMSALMVEAMKLIPMLSQGIPAKYKIADDTLTVYLDSELLLPLLKAAGPLFEDEDFVKSIMDKLPEDMGVFGSMIEGILNSAPSVIEGTSVIEIGLNLDKVQ